MTRVFSSKTLNSACTMQVYGRWKVDADLIRVASVQVKVCFAGEIFFVAKFFKDKRSTPTRTAKIE